MSTPTHLSRPIDQTSQRNRTRCGQAKDKVAFWTYDLPQVTCRSCLHQNALDEKRADHVPRAVNSAHATSYAVAMATVTEWLRAEQERVYDEAIRAVAQVDPKVVHNPYRKES